MTKDTFYFSHDYNSRNDKNIIKMMSKHGIEGYGIFWAVVENLYQNNNELETDYEAIAYDLHTDHDKVVSVINDFNLFAVKGKKFSSLEVGRRLEKRNEKSVKAKESANSRWEKMRTHNECKTDAVQPQSESYASKVKESKVKESKRERNYDVILYPIINVILKKKFIELFNTKKWIKKDVSVLELTVRKSSTYEDQFMIELIDSAIVGNWQGLYFTDTNAAYQKYLSQKVNKKTQEKLTNTADDFTED